MRQTASTYVMPCESSNGIEIENCAISANQQTAAINASNSWGAMGEVLFMVRLRNLKKIGAQRREVRRYTMR
jgi:hypothetical protein